MIVDEELWASIRNTQMHCQPKCSKFEFQAPVRRYVVRANDMNNTLQTSQCCWERVSCAQPYQRLPNDSEFACEVR